MEDLSDEILVDSYKKALNMDLKKDFISLLEIELVKRNLLLHAKKQIMND